MLPSRPRLERWNPDSLTPAGEAVRNAGTAVGVAVSGISSNLAKMADTKAWSGDAHNAATAMFVRAKIQTDSFSQYTTAVGDALKEGADTIGTARTPLLKKADEIDNSGQLHVSDQWVVLVKGGQMTVEQAAALEKRAQSEQNTVNGLLTDVGAADEAAAAAVNAAGQSHGFQLPDPTSLDRLYPGALKPGDEVPNPFSHVGATQQAILRDVEMAETLRETKVESNYDPVTGEVVSTTTTKYMMDGSRYVTTVDAKPPFPDRSPVTTEVHYDKNGSIISTTRTVKYGLSAHKDFAGKTIATTEYADGTVAKLTDWPDGKQTCKVITPEGREADVPLDVLDTPVTTVLGATGKYVGPGVSIASALFGVAVAESDFQRCVAVAEGAASVAAGTFVSIGLSEFTPIVSIPAGILAASGGEALGNWIGNTFCPR